MAERDHPTEDAYSRQKDSLGLVFWGRHAHCLLSYIKTTKQ